MALLLTLLLEGGLIIMPLIEGMFSVAVEKRLLFSDVENF